MSAPSPRSKPRTPRAPLKGTTTPRIETAPLRKLTPKTSAGYSAISFAETILRITLRPWQKHFLIHALELNEGGSLRFRTILLLVSRQNGKSVVANVLALWKIFIDGAQTILSTAQDLSTAEAMWNEGLAFIDGSPELAAEKLKVSHTNGNKNIYLTGRRKWKVAAANRSAGRGLSVDLLLMDELREQLDEQAWAALTNTTIAQLNSLVVAMTNAGDDRSILLNGLRKSAIDSIDDAETTLYIAEWSASDGCDVDDRREWQQANPSMGYGALTEDVLAGLRRTQSDAKFRTENLCQHVSIEASGPWDEGVWDANADPQSSIASGSPLLLSVDVSHNRAMAYLSVAGWRDDSKAHIEVIAQRAGTEWVVPFLTEQWPNLGAQAVAVQGRGAPATSLIEHLEHAGIPVVRVEGSDLGSSTGSFYDAVRDGRIAHLAQPVLDQAAATAVIKPLGEIWVWNRAHSPVDVAPLVAVTQAFWALTVLGTRQAAAPTISVYESEELAWA